MAATSGKPAPGAELIEAVDRLTSAVTKVAHGDVHGPGGLEGLSVAISGVPQSGV